MYVEYRSGEESKFKFGRNTTYKFNFGSKTKL